jgi:hypothetical protein
MTTRQKLRADFIVAHAASFAEVVGVILPS